MVGAAATVTESTNNMLEIQQALLLYPVYTVISPIRQDIIYTDPTPALLVYLIIEALHIYKKQPLHLILEQHMCRNLAPCYTFLFSISVVRRHPF